MVIIYNRSTPRPKNIIKNYKKNRHHKTKISRKTIIQRITPKNKKFLKSLGLKVLV